MSTDPRRRCQLDGEQLPIQYTVGEPCRAEGCGRPLSRYNPYTVCGPCRMRIALDIREEDVEAEQLDADVTGGGFYPMERFPRRKPVRRGPLMMET